MRRDASALAIGRSALHWDMICDLRHAGRLTVDEEVILERGRLVGTWT